MDIQERLQARLFRVDSGCLEFAGAKVPRGYGKIYFNGKYVYTHRVAFFLHHGKWPEPQCLHTCDNPPCCEPDHLIEGTQKDNMRDMMAKGRKPSSEQISLWGKETWKRTSHKQVPMKGSRNGNAIKISREDILRVREEYIAQEVSKAELARRYNLSETTVRNIVLRKGRWKDE